MSTDTLHPSSINAFSPFVTIPASLLQSLQEAIRTLQSEVAALQEQRDQDREEMASLRATVAALETRQEEDTTRLCVDICQDRQRLARLEQRPSTAPAPIAPPKGEKTIARIAKIDEVLKSRGPSTLKELERILGIDRATMTRLLGKLDMRRYELHSRPGDDRVIETQS
jgi:hypothetical protein